MRFLLPPGSMHGTGRPYMLPAMRLLVLVPLALFLAGLTGCVSVRPFAEIRKEIPQDQFLPLHGRLVHVEQAGTGEPVVLLHGFGGSTYSWRKVMPGLAARFRV